jgi:hypothetical protein
MPNPELARYRKRHAHRNFPEIDIKRHSITIDRARDVRPITISFRTTSTLRALVTVQKHHHIRRLGFSSPQPGQVLMLGKPTHHLPKVRWQVESSIQSGRRSHEIFDWLFLLCLRRPDSPSFSVRERFPKYVMITF